MAKVKIKTLFIDIGGVLATNGWDRDARQLAAKTFHLDLKEMESRHKLTFDTYEIGKITLKEYLDRTVFYEKRKFTRAQFEKFIFSCSQSFPEMMKLIIEVKKRHGLKVGVVSNEGCELTDYRIKKFKLEQFVDFFICSGFVGLRKPDADIYRLALDVGHAAPEEVIYLEDRELFVEVAESLGIRGLHHTSYETTCALLKEILGVY